MGIDSRGDAGFMETMVAFMAVTVVLTGFMGVMAVVSVVPEDPTESLDSDEFSGTIEEGTFVPGFMGYIEGLVWSDGLEGVSVMVDIPGFGGESGPYVVGSLDGSLHGRTFAGTVTDGFGRSVPAVFEVMLCVRAATVSSP